MAKVQTNPDQTPGLFSAMVQDFLKYIVTTKGQSEKTKKAYKDAFRLLGIYMFEVHKVSFENITFSIMTVDRIETFMNWLSTDSRKCSAKTVNNRLAAIRSFAKYAVNHNLEAASRFQYNLSKVENKRLTDTEEWSYFTTQEVMILFDLPKHNTITGRRDTTLLPFMFATAARSQEVCDLKVCDVEFLTDGRAKIHIVGKGRKKRTVTICEDVTFSLKRYMKYRNILDSPDAYIFNTQRKTKMSVDCIEDIFKKYVDIAKKEYPDLFRFKSYSPHSMRHATGVSMVEAEVPLPVIKMFFGHSCISTTEIYAKITQPHLDQKIMEWNKSFWSTITEDSSASNASDDDSSSDDKGIPAFLK